MAAGAEDGTLHLRTGHEQVDLHLAAVAFTLDAGVDADRQRIGAGVERDQRIARPVGAARVAGEGHGAVRSGEFHREIMLPMLA